MGEQVRGRGEQMCALGVGQLFLSFVYLAWDTWGLDVCLHAERNFQDGHVLYPLPRV